MNIVSYTTLIALSIAGLVVAIRKHSIFLVIYGIGLDLVYSSSFLYISRLKPVICAFVVFVSILAFIHARQISIQRSTSKVSILQANSDRELIKDRDYKYEPTTEAV